MACCTKRRSTRALLAEERRLRAQIEALKARESAPIVALGRYAEDLQVRSMSALERLVGTARDS
jgi:hypothetical protein